TLTFEQVAPACRFLHLATHGWTTMRADEPAAARGGGGDPAAFDLAERVRGLAPMTLCGLALAQANRGLDEHGDEPGLLTAEQLAGLDLSRCELVVLSACDTNVGVGMRRAGQGLQSLQAALHAAGAGHAITSLWKVDDLATHDLMLEFYR